MPPRCAKLRLDSTRLSTVSLSLESLHETIQGPAVVRMTGQIVAVGPLCVVCLPCAKKFRAEQMAHREEPTCGFVVCQPVLEHDCLAHISNRILAATLGGADA